MRSTSRVRTLSILAIAVLGGSVVFGLSISDVHAQEESDEYQPGHERGRCYGNGTCNDGLACVYTRCRSTNTGIEGAPCYGNSTCNNGLFCHENLCISQSVVARIADSVARLYVAGGESRPSDAIAIEIHQRWCRLSAETIEQSCRDGRCTVTGVDSQSGETVHITGFGGSVSHDPSIGPPQIHIARHILTFCPSLSD